MRQKKFWPKSAYSTTTEREQKTHTKRQCLPFLSHSHSQTISLPHTLAGSSLSHSSTFLYWFRVLTILHRTDNVSPFFYYYYIHIGRENGRAREKYKDNVCKRSKDHLSVIKWLGNGPKSLKYYAYTSPPMNRNKKRTSMQTHKTWETKSCMSYNLQNMCRCSSFALLRPVSIFRFSWSLCFTVFHSLRLRFSFVFRFSVHRIYKRTVSATHTHTLTQKLSLSLSLAQR